MQKIRGKKLFSILLVILLSIEIFHFSSLSGVEGIPTKGGNLIPIAYHFIVFFLFSFFVLSAIKGNKKMKSSYILTTWIISIIQAILDEIHQIFVPFRGAGLEDVLINSIGIFSATILFLISKNYYKLLKISPILRGKKSI